jgi:hypothetical protein
VLIDAEDVVVCDILTIGGNKSEVVEPTPGEAAIVVVGAAPLPVNKAESATSPTKGTLCDFMTAMLYTQKPVKQRQARPSFRPEPWVRRRAVLYLRASRIASTISKTAELN